MRAYSLSHLSDPELLHGLASLIAQDRATTAALLAHIAEVDARRLNLPASSPRSNEQLAPGRVERPGPDDPGAPELAPAQVVALEPERPLAPAGQLAPGQVGMPSKPEPEASERFLLKLTIGRSTHDKLRYAQDLLGQELPSGDLAQVVERALEALVEKSAQPG